MTGFEKIKWLASKGFYPMLRRDAGGKGWNVQLSPEPCELKDFDGKAAGAAVDAAIEYAKTRIEQQGAPPCDLPAPLFSQL